MRKIGDGVLGACPHQFGFVGESTTDAVSRQLLRSASRHQLIVPEHRRTNFGRPAFTVAGPTAWNSLPDYLRDPSQAIIKDIPVCVVLVHEAH